MAREWILAQAKSLTKNMIMPNSTLQQQQGAPRDRSVTSITIVCKTDASWDKAKKTGLGWIYTREEDTGTSQSTKIQESVASPLMAEARAEKDIFEIFFDIEQLSSVFHSFSFDFLPRTHNLQADRLTRKTFVLLHL
ncbi:hypothetical protein F2Q69_00050159, partial [Brassica cretica]